MPVGLKCAKIRTAHASLPVSARSVLSVLFAVSFFLIMFTFCADAAQVSLNWDDLKNDPAEVGGYNLYYWQDGQTPAVVNVGDTRTYTLTGLNADTTYHFATTAHDGNGGRESAFSNEVTHTTPPAAAAPNASFSTTPVSGPAPLLVAFADTSTGNITSWSWDFGDGNTSTVQHPTHTYTILGTYSVTLTVRGPDGSHTASTLITVSDPASGCPCSLWDGGTTPAVVAASDTAAVEVGLKFQAEVDGQITAIRFYKGAGNTGTHVGHLWTNSGTLLASVTFSNETASGWQQATLATPVAITANTTYVVSYYAPVGRYAVNAAYFTTAFAKSPLRAPASGSAGGNGVYKYGPSGFPTQTYNATNYWVDVVFNSTPTSTMVAAAVASDGNGISNADEEKYGTSPTMADTDHDGVPDNEEITYWGENWNVNYDNDAIANNLLDPDADNDGYTDGLELHYGSNPTDPTSIPALTDIMLIGDVQVDHTWQQVTFTVPFLDPVVVVTPLSHNDPEPAVVRIRNVRPTGFEMRLQEWDYLDGTHPFETISYMVMERGHHTLRDGTQVEADTLANATTSFQTMSFAQPFHDAPVVISSIVTDNEADAVTGRVSNINLSRFQYRLQEQKLNTQEHAAEIVSYIAWEPSAGAIDGLTVEVSRTADAVQDDFYGIAFAAPFLDSPAFVADMQSADGGDPANLRWRNKGPAGVEVKVDEEQSKDRKTTHTTEVVGYIAIR